MKPEGAFVQIPRSKFDEVRARARTSTDINLCSINTRLRLRHFQRRLMISEYRGGRSLRYGYGPDIEQRVRRSWRNRVVLAVLGNWAVVQRGVVLGYARRANEERKPPRGRLDTTNGTWTHTRTLWRAWRVVFCPTCLALLLRRARRLAPPYLPRSFYLPSCDPLRTWAIKAPPLLYASAVAVSYRGLVGFLRRPAK